MWRELSADEKKALIQSRGPLYKGIALLEAALLVLVAVFTIDNLVTLITDRTNGAAIGLAVDCFLIALIILGSGFLRKVLASDAKKGELQICEAIIDEMLSERLSNQVITSVHKEDSMTYSAMVHPSEEPFQKYKVRIDAEAYGKYKAGDRVMLVCSKDEITEESMMLLEVR